MTTYNNKIHMHKVTEAGPNWAALLVGRATTTTFP